MSRLTHYWTWICLIPILLLTILVIAFGPYLTRQSVARRLTHHGATPVYVILPETWFRTLIESIPGFELYGEQLSHAYVYCERPSIRAHLQDIVADARYLQLPLHVDLADSPDITQEFRLLQSARLAGIHVRDSVIRTSDLKLLQCHRDLLHVSFVNCQFEQSALHELSQLRSLTSIMLQGSTFPDEELKSLDQLKNLTGLSLSNTNASIEAKEHVIKALPQLELTDD